MTVVILRFKGGGDTLRKGFDTVSEALSVLGPAIPRRALPTLPPQETPSGHSVDESELGAEKLERTGQPAEEDSAGAPRQRHRPRFLDELNLEPDGQQSWKDYAQEKAPRTSDEQYLVAAGWLAEHGGHEVFRGAHIFSCFRAMKWAEPVDFTQPMRRLKQRRSYFEVPKRGEWKLTQVGVTAVAELPHRDGG
jgi:hypothetical protein